MTVNPPISFGMALAEPALALASSRAAFFPSFSSAEGQNVLPQRLHCTTLRAADISTLILV
jgi:hypothetical protein